MQGTSKNSQREFPLGVKLNCIAGRDLVVVT